MDVLKNKEYKDYNRLSRYASFPYFYNTLDNKCVVEIPTALDPNTLYSTYIVQAGDTYDFISLKSYNNPTYYWIICNANNIFDPLVNPTPGTRLRIPQLSTIQFRNY